MTALKNAPTIQAELVHYKYNLSYPEQAIEYRELCADLKSQGYKLLAMISSSKPDSTETGTVELECNHLFSNQWNTTDTSPTNPGKRVFDWYESITPNRKFKSGHYLLINDAMRDIRANVLKCGYCGNHEWKEGAPVFCPACLDSEYLDKGTLYMTRLQPITQEKRPALTEAEAAELIPKWKEAQLHGTTVRGKARIAKQRADITASAQKAIENAVTERDGLLWLLDHGVNIDNVIYYKHTGRFCFGWRQPIDDELYSDLVDVLCEFCFDYDIKRVQAA